MRNLVYILFFLIPLLGTSQVDTVARLHTFGGINNDNAEEVEATSDGGYIVVGSTSSNSSGNTDIYLLKVDSLCNYQWSYAIGGSNNDWGYSIKETFDKGFIIATSSNSNINGGYNAVLMKRDSLGNYVWEKVYGGQDWDIPHSVVQTYDSGYVFCGETYNNTNGFSDVYIVKTNPLGDTLWTKTIGGSLIDKGNSVIETSDSNIVVGGVKNTVTDSAQIYILKLAPNGTLLWDSIYGTSGYDDLNDIVETQDGGFVGVGSTTGVHPGTDKDIYFYKVDINGSFLWGRDAGHISMGVNKEDEGFGVCELSNGQLCVSAYTETFGAGEKDVIVYLLGSTGWASVGPTFGGVLDESPKSVTIGKNEDIVVAGKTKSFGEGLEDVLLIRFDTLYGGMDMAVSTYSDNIEIGLLEIENNIDIKVFPTPSQGMVNFQFDAAVSFVDCRLLIYDSFGRVVIDKLFNEKNTVVNLEPYSKGVYTYRFVFDNQIQMAGKLIVE